MSNGKENFTSKVIHVGLEGLKNMGRKSVSSARSIAGAVSSIAAGGYGVGGLKKGKKPAAGKGGR